MKNKSKIIPVRIIQVSREGEQAGAININTKVIN